MPLGDFEWIEPELAKELRAKGEAVSAPFHYHLTKGLNVERCALVDLEASKAPFEAHKGSKKKVYSKVLHARKRDYTIQEKLVNYTRISSSRNQS